jgi:DNA polymerase-3 subunit chi
MADAPTIDFHVNVDDCIGYACRVVRKARSAGNTILVYCRDHERLMRLDRALWTFSALDFLPHVALPSALAPQTPIWLSQTPPDDARDLLLLLDAEPAPQFTAWFARFARVIDLASKDPADRAQARSRFKAYRDAGLTAVVHDIGA